MVKDNNKKYDFFKSYAKSKGMRVEERANFFVCYSQSGKYFVAVYKDRIDNLFYYRTISYLINDIEFELMKKDRGEYNEERVY